MRRSNSNSRNGEERGNCALIGDSKRWVGPPTCKTLKCGCNSRTSSRLTLMVRVELKKGNGNNSTGCRVIGSYEKGAVLKLFRWTRGGLRRSEGVGPRRVQTPLSGCSAPIKILKRKERGRIGGKRRRVNSMKSESGVGRKGPLDGG